MKKNIRKKIMLIFGTRPEIIKVAPVIKKMEEYSDTLKPIICNTAQHRQMLDQILNGFNIKPQYDLNIMEENQTLFKVTSKCILRLEEIIIKKKPDMVIVQGDTTTTFIASLASFYFKIPVGYIEAGLRTTDKFNPFPEEMNRRLTSVVADIYFAPTRVAKNNLIKEGIDNNKIFITGNTAIDALFMVKNNSKFDIFKNLGIDSSKKIILVTAHRREKFGMPFKQICYALKDIVEKNKDVELIYPVHLNPNVQTVVGGILTSVDRIHLISPVSYVSFVQLMKKSYLIITDSGGIQEEAPSLGKPVVVIRNITERPEGVKVGAAKIGGEQRDKIVNVVCNILNNKKLYRKMSMPKNIYGDGKASERIVKVILNYFKLGRKPKEFIS